MTQITERIRPAIEVPVDLEKYKFTVTGDFGGEKFYTSQVPLWQFKSNFEQFQTRLYSDRHRN